MSLLSHRYLNVVMDITGRCNLKCKMCYFSQVDMIVFKPFNLDMPERGDMPVSLLKKIAQEIFPFTRSLALSCSAEPLMHPGFMEILDIASRYGIPDIWFPTNGLLLKEKIARKIIQSGIKTIAISIDGATKETYERIRLGGKFEKLMENIEILSKLKRECRSRLPVLRFIVVVMKSNYRELPRIVELARSLGASELDIRYVSQIMPGLNLQDEKISADCAEAAFYLEEALQIARMHRLKLVFMPNLPSAPKRGLPDFLLRCVGRLKRFARRQNFLGTLRFCNYPWDTVVIRPNGYISPCIYWVGEPFGSLNERSFQEIWRGAQYEKLRDELKRGPKSDSCLACAAKFGEFEVL